MIKANGISVYQELSEIIEPGHSCLVVWDVQNGLVDRIFNKEEFMASLKGLVATLRTKMPIVYTLITPLPREFQSSWGIYAMMRRFKVKEVDKLPDFMTPGSRERETLEAVKPAKGDIILDKSAGAFL